MSKFSNYFKEDPGLLLALGFQALLISMIVLLATGNSEIAPTLGVYAFLSVLAGVVFQVFWVALKSH